MPRLRARSRRGCFPFLHRGLAAVPRRAACVPEASPGAGRPGALAGRVRRAAALVFCASLAAPLLGAGGSAEAQVLVSNLGVTASTTDFRFESGSIDLAQVFTTGANEAGYTLASIEVAFDLAISAADIGDLSVEVWSVDSSGYPSVSEFVLVNPGSIAQATNSPVTDGNFTVTGNYAVFTAPGGTTLTKTTNYAVVLEYDAGGVWDTAQSTTETFAASGWSIADVGAQKQSGSWSFHPNDSILIRVNAPSRPAPTPPRRCRT